MEEMSDSKVCQSLHKGIWGVGWSLFGSSLHTLHRTGEKEARNEMKTRQIPRSWSN